MLRPRNRAADQWRIFNIDRHECWRLLSVISTLLSEIRRLLVMGTIKLNFSAEMSLNKARIIIGRDARLMKMVV